MKHPTRTGEWNLICAAGGGSFKNHYCIFSMFELKNKAVLQEQNMSLNIHSEYTHNVYSYTSI